MVRKEGRWSVGVRWEDLQMTFAVIAYSTRVRTGLRARVIVGVSRGGEVGGRSEPLGV
jgi:hypothetical protein